MKKVLFDLAFAITSHFDSAEEAQAAIHAHVNKERPQEAVGSPVSASEPHLMVSVN